MLSKILIVALALFAAASAADKVKASLYFESYCPGCEYFITHSLVELHETEDILAITDLELVPYGNAKVLTRDPPTFKCQHGDRECYGNYVELCAQEHYPEKWWPFILCQETSVDFSDEGVEKCAAASGMDAQVILSCAKGTEGPALHLIAADKTPADHKWVPWIVVDGTALKYTTDFFKAICEAYKGEKPASCSKYEVLMNEAPKVKATLYFESYCPGCEYFITNDLVKLHETEDLLAITDLELVPYGNARVISRDPPTFQCQHGDRECYGNYVELCAQEHYPEKWWPFILCQETSVDFSDEGVEKCAAASGMDAQVILSCAKGTEGPALHLIAADKTPADHQWVPWVVVDGKVMGETDDFFQMICDAYKGEKPASCTKASKNEAPKVKATLYFESYCPGCEYFITNDLVKLHETEDLLAITDLELVPYGNAHVISRDPPTFQCQHGDRECYGNYVELCAQEHYPEKWWPFILCQETSVDFSDEGVEKCAAASGMDAQVILSCAKGTEGPALHLIAADKTPADHKWVPWVVVDGKVMGETDDFFQMICDAYKGEKPASCK